MLNVVATPLPQTLAVVLWILLAGCCLAEAYRVAAANESVPSPMEAQAKFPELTKVTMYAKMFSPELVTCVEDPTTACTVIAPNNQAITNAMDAMGQYVGLILGNQTLRNMMLEYHVISGQKLKAEDMGPKVRSLKTRQGEPVYFVQYKGVPHVAFGREYVQPIEIANIPAGGCILHVIGQTLMAPPNLAPTLKDWLQKADNATALQAPPTLWLTAFTPASAEPPARAGSSPAANEALIPTAKTLDGSSTTGSRITPEAGVVQPVGSGVVADKMCSLMFVVATAVVLFCV